MAVLFFEQHCNRGIAHDRRSHGRSSQAWDGNRMDTYADDLRGFEMAVAKDATAEPKHPKWGYGYTAALFDYAYLARAVCTTDEVVDAMERGR